MLFFCYTEAWQKDPEWRMIALHLEKKEHLD
ncbi:branch migration of Holliday junctions%2C junction-specific DNA helicase%2CATP-dependent DNA helicase%2C recG homolog [Streptococcus pneumoniae]|nr:branch migration of Holliday junctions%2C junction-specific DNA helicase%2CATP-dependent DNA helicase%2C recG homolog [Streptococcus pneumoniae]